jgi:signal transduction histidine kinase
MTADNEEENVPVAPDGENDAGMEPRPEAESGAEAEGNVNPQEVYNFLRMAGQTINNSALYGPNHKITTRGMSESYEALASILARQSRINLSVIDGELLVEAKPIEMKNPFINIFADKLSAAGVTGFSLLRGMPQAEFNKLMTLLLSAKAEDESGEFADKLEQNQLEFIQAERIKYERVTESETVVEKEDAEEAQAAAVAAAAVEQIMAFLKGDAGVAAEQVAHDLNALSTDADRLANLIMEAAAIRQQQTGIAEGESLADIVVGCLRRTFEGLVKDPSARSKKGKNAVKKIMLMLEKTVLDKLHAISQGADPELDEAIAGAVDEMIGDLEVDTLTADYVRKRKALEDTEKRVLKYMKSHEDSSLSEELEERLVDAGLTPEGWRELVVKSETEKQAGSGKGPGEGGGPGTDPVSVGVLAMLLSELDEMMQSVANPRALSSKLSEIGQKAQEVASVAEQRIEDFGKVLQQEDEVLIGLDEAQQAQVKMSRQSMVELLAEIVQELCQSLSAINCAVGMTLAGHIGDINEDQRQVLNVAATCGHRLDELLDRIIEIVGLPKGLQPDKEKVYGAGYEDPQTL